MIPDVTQAFEVIERSWLCVLPVSALVQVLACSRVQTRSEPKGNGGSKGYG